ncbi:MAG: hypothetical protein JWM56_404 [Candidatus Peribacteria bacterium]|nr:hypothetical protein [Candidatus Peribacteria bacterium]
MPHTDPLLIHTQFVLFFAQPIGKPEEFWKQLQQTELGQVFNQTPLIQPVPMDHHSMEIPVVQIGSSQGHALSIARMRADIMFLVPHGPDSDANPHPLFQSFFKLFEEQTLVRRVGYVKRWFITDNEPVKRIGALLAYNPEDRQGGTLQEVFIRYTTRQAIYQYDCNNFTNIEPATVNASNADTMTGILVTKDINTIPEQNYLFDADTLKTFFTEADILTTAATIQNLVA